MRRGEQERPNREDPVAAVVAVVREVLANNEITGEDNFFAVGGDSILALQVIVLAARRGLSIDVVDVLGADSLVELAGLAVGRVRVAPGPVAEDAGGSELTLPPGASAILPASALQIGMMFLAEMAAPRSGAYLSFYGFRVAPADLSSLLVALEGLVERHEALRSRFDLVGHAVPAQVILPWAALEPEVVTAPSGVDVTGLLATWRRRIVDEGIDLSAAPVLRCLVVVSDNALWVGLATHHSLVDGWSFHRLVVDLLLLYDAALDGRVAGLPDVPSGMSAEFVHLEREALDSARARSHWDGLARSRRSRIGGGRAEVASATRRVALEVAPGVWAGLERAAAALRIPAKSLCLAVHARALGRTRQIEEVWTGLVTDCRPEVDGADRVIGLFLNTVPLVLPAAGSWDKLARAAFDAERAMIPHRRYPLAAMTTAHGGPLFDVTFNFTHFHVLRELDGLRRAVADTWWTDDVATFSCMVNVFAQDPVLGTGATVSYDPDRVAASDARTLLGEIEAALTEASRLTAGSRRGC